MSEHHLATHPGARRRSLALIALVALAAGCATAGTLHMRAARALPALDAPPAGRARVVFAMPGRSRGVVGIVDQRGTFYGELDSESAFAVEVEPGAYRFYAIRDRNGAAVDVPRLEAGQTAYVEGVDPRFTSFVFRSLTGCDEAARAARRGLDRLRWLEPDPSASHEAVIASLGDIPRRIDEADRDLRAMTPAERRLRTVDPESLAAVAACDGGASGPATSSEPASSEPSAPASEPSAATTSEGGASGG